MSQVRYHTIPAFITLWQIFSVATTQLCRSEYSIYGMMLKRHIFNKTKAANWHKCVQACDNDIRCQSINYVISESMCELNNRTKEARPEDFVTGGDRAYMTRFERVPLGSTPEVPAESCDEIKASEGENAVSGDSWLLDSTKPGEVTKAHCKECINYQVLTNDDRKVTNKAGPLKCDIYLGPAWFRFLGDAGTKMPTSCVPSHRCGAHATGWLNGAHPTVAEGKVTRQVCFSWFGCCRWAINIQVRNCGSYFAYYISGTPPEQRCSLRYCGTDV